MISAGTKQLDKIITTIVDSIIDIECITVGGSIGGGKAVDEFSDLDLFVYVADKSFVEAHQQTSQLLESGALGNGFVSSAEPVDEFGSKFTLWSDTLGLIELFLACEALYRDSPLKVNSQIVYAASSKWNNTLTDHGRHAQSRYALKQICPLILETHYKTGKAIARRRRHDAFRYLVRYTKLRRSIEHMVRSAQWISVERLTACAPEEWLFEVDRRLSTYCEEGAWVKLSALRSECWSRIQRNLQESWGKESEWRNYFETAGRWNLDDRYDKSQ